MWLCESFDVSRSIIFFVGFPALDSAFGHIESVFLHTRRRACPKDMVHILQAEAEISRPRILIPQDTVVYNTSPSEMGQGMLSSNSSNIPHSTLLDYAFLSPQFSFSG